MDKLASAVLIEDNDGDARLVREYLAEGFGPRFQLRVAPTLQAGLELLAERNADIVLLDLMLPDCAGLEALAGLHCALPQQPVLVLTGFDDDQQAVAAVAAGADDYLAKRHADGVLLPRAMRHVIERRLASEQLRTRNAELATTNVELSDFGGMVAHELRTPLNAIIGSAAVIRMQDPLTERQQRSVALIDASARSMDGIVTGLLQLVCVGGSALKREPLDLSAMAADIGLAMADQRLGGPVAFSVQPGLRACGDPALLRVVLQNLLSNAFKYGVLASEPEVRFERHDGADGAPAFVVRDNGPGFDMRHANQLFKAFSRLPSSRALPGHGIGLATVRRIIERHEGKVWAESTRGEGAAFFFTLGT